MGYAASGDENIAKLVDAALTQGKGILNLGGGRISKSKNLGVEQFGANWVPRSFCVAGRRIKQHPHDYGILGKDRGELDERWFASTTPADNGDLTFDNEGMSFIIYDDGNKVHRINLKEAIEVRGEQIIGKTQMEKYGKWMMYSKFFDNLGPLPHHVHHRDEHAALTNDSEGNPNLGKPEAYYFPPQANNYGGQRDTTYFGLNSGTSPEEFRQCLVDFENGVMDNHLLELSHDHKLEVGTGWYVPPGVLHAPGSLCTYEPQKASDVFAMYEQVPTNPLLTRDLLWKNTPTELQHTDKGIDHLVKVVDWDKNVDPDFVKNYFMRPKPVKPLKQMEGEGYIETWISYKTDEFCAKELTVLPGKTVTIKDSACYGFITMQGSAQIGVWDAKSPNLIYFGQDTDDEYFVTESAAQDGVLIKNLSKTGPLVLLKHFGPDNPDLKRNEVERKISLPRNYVGSVIRRMAA